MTVILGHCDDCGEWGRVVDAAWDYLDEPIHQRCADGCDDGPVCETCGDTGTVRRGPSLDHACPTCREDQ